MYKLVFYVPSSHAEKVKEAVFSTGAGRIGLYDKCCWQIEGTGQFRPLDGSDPFIGTAKTLEKVAEVRVEMVCQAEFIRSALAALIEAHPYEEPAYDVMAVVDTTTL